MVAQPSMSHFFAYLSRMRFIQRWGLMHNTYPENVAEHSLQVALVAHALAVIRNRNFGGDVSPERVATLALFHDASEVLTGDLPAPIKYFNPEIKTAYKSIERSSAAKLLEMVPPDIEEEYRPLLGGEAGDTEGKDPEHHELVAAADKICAYLKCLAEIGAGNQEFSKAAKALLSGLEASDLPEVRYFFDTFVPSFKLTLDELD
jgi:5'-deoxynucleotidase